MPTVRTLPCLLTPLAALSLLAGCAVTPAPPQSSATLVQAAPQKRALETPQMRAQYQVMLGEMAAGRQQPRVAAKAFYAALQDVPDAKLAARATGLAVRAGDDALGLKIARRWLQIEPSSGRARDVIIRLGLRQKRADLVERQCREIIDQQPEGRAQAYHLVSQLLSQEPASADVAAGVMQKLVARDADYAPAHEAAALLALHSSDLPGAEHEARAALKIDPNAKDASLLLAGALIRESRLDDADAVMAGLYRNDAHADALKLGYAQMLMQAHHNSHARRQLQQLLAAHPHNDDARFLLALAELNSGELDAARRALKAIAPSRNNPQRNGEVEYYLGRIAEARHQPEDAIRHYAAVTQGNQAVPAVLRRAVLLGRQGRLDEAEDLLRQTSQRYPQMDDELIITESQILLDADQADDAAALLERALSVQPGNVDLLYSRSLAYERLGHVKRAEADLRTILAQTPDDPRALNALGYMLSEHNSDQLSEAHQLIAKALKMTPDDPAVMDSMGWVLYRQGHPDQALPILRKAYGLMPDPEVAAHLVTVLSALGDRAEARNLLQDALKANPGNASLQQAADRLK